RYTSVIFLILHHTPNINSFPTRRSSDLVDGEAGAAELHVREGDREAVHRDAVGRELRLAARDNTAAHLVGRNRDQRGGPRLPPRSEEHTSELQSRFDLVCRLLLEKKKNK